MTDPVTWGVVLTGLGAGVSAVGAIRQGQAQQAMFDYQAKVARGNAGVAEAQGAAAVEAQQRDVARRMGSATAAYGASGVASDTGSPMDALMESAALAELDSLTLKHAYKMKALGYNTQAEIDSASGENSRTASYFNAAGSMLSGGSRIAAYYIH